MTSTDEVFTAIFCFDNIFSYNLLANSMAPDQTAPILHANSMVPDQTAPILLANSMAPDQTALILHANSMAPRSDCSSGAV